MSKPFFKRTIAALTIFTFLAFSFFQPLHSNAQVKSRKASNKNLSKTASVVKMTGAMLIETSKIRELPILRPVKSGTKTRTQIEQIVLKNLEQTNAPGSIKAEELLMKKLGLVPKDFDYRLLIKNLLTEQIAGFYDPKTKEFFLADWLSLDAQKPVMIHELTHVLQDQHFDLLRFEKWSKNESDSRLAISALIEGDAVGSMTQYMIRNPLTALKSMALENNSSSEFNNAPRVLRESFIFPYRQGSEFAARLYSKGGWSLVSSAYKNLPQSTEHILHVEKYLAGEKPVKIELPNLSSELGEDWKQVVNNVNGEWGYFQFLADFVSGSEEAIKAVSGWGGDRYTVYINKKDEVVFLARTAWDSEKDAQEFFDAYTKRTNNRYGIQNQTNNLSQGILQGAFWKTNEGQVILLKNSSNVLILEGVPDGVNTESLISKMWMSK